MTEVTCLVHGTRDCEDLFTDVHWRREDLDLDFNFTTSTFMMGLLILQVVRVVKPEPRERGMRIQYHHAHERLIWPLPVDFFWPPQFSFTDETSLEGYQSRRFPTPLPNTIRTSHDRS